MEKAESNKLGFQTGLQAVYATRTAAEYDQCMKELVDVCMNTEERGNSRSSFYNKRYGRMALTVAEAERVGAVFAKYGVTDWRGVESNENEN